MPTAPPSHSHVIPYHTMYTSRGEYSIMKKREKGGWWWGTCCCSVSLCTSPVHGYCVCGVYPVYRSRVCVVGLCCNEHARHVVSVSAFQCCKKNKSKTAPQQLLAMSHLPISKVGQLTTLLDFERYALSKLPCPTKVRHGTRRPHIYD